MELSPLTAISPLDGRYHNKVSELQPIFSEFGLIRNRFIVEIRWLQTLCAHPQFSECPALSPKANEQLESWLKDFSVEDAQAIKTLEKTTNHDVKAVEYFIKEKLATVAELSPLQEMVHFACTSEDINNLAYGLMLKSLRQDVLLSQWDKLIAQLTEFAQRYAADAMLARTHGQAATPTTFGKEMANVVARLQRQRQQLIALPILGKFNGAVGNYNAHQLAYPEVDWPQLSQSFIDSLGLAINPYTTQIEPHDYLAEWCHTVMRWNTIVIDLCRDMWGYISVGYLQLRPVAGEVGSSTMPHKVNPIDFENAEGNFGLANALLQHLANHLPISRWQRDLSDSTRLRNLGVAFAHGVLAGQSCLGGLSKIAPDTQAMQAEVNQQWAVLAEAVQTVMRRYGLEAPYEQLKVLTRGKRIEQQDLQAFIQQLALPEQVKQTLLDLTPEQYVGIAAELAKGV